MVTIAAALRTCAARLEGASDTPRLDAELLMAHALGITREALLLGRGEAPVPPAYAALVERRLAREPIAYLTGARAFWTIDLAVGPGVLIPRPDSETLIEAAVAHFAGREGPRRILDLGTGSGALLLAALSEWPAAAGIGVDMSAEAIDWARRNVRALDPGARARIVHGDWSGHGGPHDLILCNPPYVATSEPLPDDVRLWEPATALFAGADGLDAYRLIAPALAPQLAPRGVACIEIGATQGAAVRALFERAGFLTSIRRDLGGRERCVVATRPG